MSRETILDQSLVEILDEDGVSIAVLVGAYPLDDSRETYPLARSPETHPLEGVRQSYPLGVS